MGNTVGTWKRSGISSPILTSVFDYTATNIDGVATPLSSFKSSKAMLIVNVACHCGLTKSQYPAMVNLRRQLREEYPNGFFEILCFPCAQFANQEFAKDADTKHFVQQYNVDFPMFSKIEVNGPRAHQLYQFLKFNTPEFVDRGDPPTLGPIGWNFGKFLIDSEGHVVKYYGPKINPAAIKDDCVKVIKGELRGTSKTPPTILMPGEAEPPQ